MEETVNDQIESLLAEIQDDIDDPETSFKLRTARQLNLVSKTQFRAIKDAIEEVNRDHKEPASLQANRSISSQSSD